MSSIEQHPENCQCALHTPQAAQSLDELDFLKSACSAAQTGNLDRLEKLIKNDSLVVLADGSGGRGGYTPLHYAARAGQYQAARLLLQSGTVLPGFYSAALRPSALMHHADLRC